MIKCRTKEERSAYVRRMLRIFRRLSGKTQEQMAEEMGISRSKYQSMEEGKWCVTLDDVGNIPVMFGVNAEKFLQCVMFNITAVRDIDYDMERGWSHEKQRARAMAADLEPFGCVPLFQSELSRLGKRYGLTDEFRSRRILE